MFLQELMRTEISRATRRLLLITTGCLFIIALSIRAAAAERSDILGKITTHVIAGEETLLDVARHHGLGFVEVVAANPGVDPWLPEVGTMVHLPTAHILPDAPRQGIVVNLPELRLYYFPPNGGTAQSFPIGIGREGLLTPLGETKVVRKQANPTWFPTAETRAEKPYLPARVGPGPDNPLGAYALYLGWPAYLIHGTNNQWAIGRRVSRGCLRLYPEDIETLFRQVPVGTPVTVVDQPVKVGWRDGRLYLEVHPSQSQVDQIELDGSFSPEPVPDLVERIIAATPGRSVELDWPMIDRAVADRYGIPVQISH